VGKPISWQATILWDPGSDDEGWLVYAYSPEFGHPLQGATPPYMVGRRIRFVPAEKAIDSRSTPRDTGEGRR
jgi:hypothetical protein